MGSLDMDDIFMQATEDLEEELGREPTPEEIAKLAMHIYDDKLAAQYDYPKAVAKGEL